MTFAALAITLLTSKVLAVQMIGLGPVGGGTPGGPSNTDVLMIETSPFAVSVLGLAGVPSLSGLDFQPGTGLLFASGGFNDGGNLYTVNPTSVVTTLIGATGYDAVGGLAFDLDGTLFGAAAPVGSDPSAGEFHTTLITIDPDTGGASLVGLFGVKDIDGLAVDPTTNTLYAVGGNFPRFDELFTVDKSTGVATSLGAITEFGTGNPTPDFIAGLAFDGFGNLFGSVGFGDGRIISIDFSGTPTYTILGDARAGSVSDIAIAPAPVAALDHFLCYKAKSARGEPKFERREVDLDDQFGATTKTVKKPKFLCTPVAKDGEGIINPAGHLVCYEVKRLRGQDKFEKRNVLVFNQFEDEEKGRILTVKKPRILCVPSTKEDLGVVGDDKDRDKDKDKDRDDDDDDDDDD